MVADSGTVEPAWATKVARGASCMHDASSLYDGFLLQLSASSKSNATPCRRRRIAIDATTSSNVHAVAEAESNRASRQAVYDRDVPKRCLLCAHPTHQAAHKRTHGSLARTLTRCWRRCAKALRRRTERNGVGCGFAGRIARSDRYKAIGRENRLPIPRPTTRPKSWRPRSLANASERRLNRSGGPCGHAGGSLQSSVQRCVFLIRHAWRCTWG